MFLTDFILKPLFVNENTRGITLAIGISLKNYTVKYLFCNSISPQPHTENPLLQSDFAISFSAVKSVSKTHISLSSLRPVFPKSCAKLTLGQPVYLQTGEKVGTLQNVEIQNGVAAKIFTESNSYSIGNVCAVSDAILLRKNSIYPLGQRIPAPTIFDFLTEKDVLITKTILKKAIEKGALIKLTSSLSPFENTPTKNKP